MEGINIEAGNSVKYLGIRIDTKLRFNLHAKEVASKASLVAHKLGRIMPNISAASVRKRRLICNVVQSLLLYGAPLWADRLCSSGREQLLRVQRRSALTVASLYSTVSLEASLVLANMLPIDLVAQERKEIYEASALLDQDRETKQRARSNLLGKWQSRWDTAKTGRWTHQLIGDVSKWHGKKHGELCFHLAQALSGHGCFTQYLCRFGKLESPECWYCGHPEDNAHYTIFKCDAWYTRRRRLKELINSEITPENVVDIMME